MEEMLISHSIHSIGYAAVFLLSYGTTIENLALPVLPNNRHGYRGHGAPGPVSPSFQIAHLLRRP